eukprot:sb/3470060/
MMFQGRVGAALRLLSNTPSVALETTPEVIAALKAKHPDAAELSMDCVVSTEPAPSVEPATFQSIHAASIQRAAAETRGGSGPSGMSDKLWTRMLNSKSLGNAAESLAHEISLMTRRLCTNFVDPSSLSALLCCKLIALDKEPGAEKLKVRPIGVGEVLRRIIGRTVTQHLKPEIIEAAGPLQRIPQGERERERLRDRVLEIERGTLPWKEKTS